jgi:hypothetical protein
MHALHRQHLVHPTRPVVIAAVVTVVLMIVLLVTPGHFSGSGAGRYAAAPAVAPAAAGAGPSAGPVIRSSWPVPFTAPLTLAWDPADFWKDERTHS